MWEDFRNAFRVTESLVYLNHAGVSPLCRPAADAMKHLTEDAFRFGSFHYDRWLEAYEGFRVTGARLIGADRDEIAIVKNTSEGIATVQMGIEWKPGDRVVCFREEFPANFYPWKKLEERGVELAWMSIYDSLDAIDEAARGARLLAISFVNYLSGYRVDLEAIGEICHRHGVFFLVDAIQGLGIVPVDVRKCRIHALAADGHKWLMGPEGCGILFVAREVLERVVPVEFGWTNVAGYNDYSSRDMTLRPDAGRYECGTLNTVGVYGLRAAMNFVLEIGVERIGAEVIARADEFAEGLSARGFELLGRRTPETAAGIVTFRKEGVESRMIIRALKDAGIFAAPRQGYVRVSPHCYISPDDVARTILEVERASK